MKKLLIFLLITSVFLALPRAGYAESLREKLRRARSQEAKQKNTSTVQNSGENPKSQTRETSSPAPQQTGACEDFAKYIKKCTPFVCIQHYPNMPQFLIKHTITGTDEGTCHYQRLMSNGRLEDCYFTPSMQRKISDYANAYYSGTIPTENPFIEAFENGQCMITEAGETRQ